MYKKIIHLVLAIMVTSNLTFGQERDLNKTPFQSEGSLGSMKWNILGKARTGELGGEINQAETECFYVQVKLEGVDLKVPKANDNRSKASFKIAEISGLQGITTIMEEDFEGAFPTGLWQVFDADGATHGEYYWGKDTYNTHSGNYSTWCAKDGVNGINPPHNYLNYCNSWMVYGPFDLSDPDINVAELNFSFWLDSEVRYDYFFWGASINGTNFYGTAVSGTTWDRWWYESFNLTNVPILGNLTGYSSVWIAFVFQSDVSTTQKGAFVDDIVLQKGHVESPITFTDIGSSAGVAHVEGGRGVAWGDFDNDDDLDLYLANMRGLNCLYRNNDNNTFTNIASSANVSGSSSAPSDGVAWGDFDNDGYWDLFVANDGGADKLYRNNGNITFTDISSSAGVEDLEKGVSAAWADFDRDGDLDLYLTKYERPNRLYRNNGDNTFIDIAASAGVADAQDGESIGIAWGDYDNDGDLDLFLVSWSQPGRLYRNNGDNTFMDIANWAGVANSEHGHGVGWWDFDNDGDLDLYVVIWDEADRLYRNNGDNTFTDIASSAGVLGGGRGLSMALGDFDNDGYLDLYMGSLGGQACRLYHNNGNSTFTDVAPAVGLDDIGQTDGMSWGDFDNDGDLDLYVSNANSANHLFRNDGSSNNWLVLKLVGTISNRAGIGARVRAVAGTLSQIREVSGGGYYSQNSLPVEFGFGQETIIDSLIIRWPSGIRQVILNIAPNQIITIQEQETPPAILVSILDTSAACGDTIDIPVLVDDVTEKGIISAGITVETDTSVLIPLSTHNSSTISECWGNPTFNVSEGQITIAMSGTAALSGSGPLVYIRYLVNPRAATGDTTLIHLADVLFNEGEPPVQTKDGVFTVRADTATVALFLNEGWNMISFNVIPPDPAVETVMSPVVDKLALMKDGAGNVYIPQYGINNICDINYKEGYQVYMTEARTLKVIGIPAYPTTPIELRQGWNMIGYLPDVPIDIEIALASIKDKLEIAKNNAGKVYVPEYNINTIGQMLQGQGYQVYLNAPDTLIYPSGSRLALTGKSNAAYVSGRSPSTHFYFTANTGENATIILPAEITPKYSDGTPLQNEDEIGVFTKNGTCCGAIVWQESNTAITAWGNNSQTERIDGFQAGDSLLFRAWKKCSGVEYPVHISYRKGHHRSYRVDGFSVLADFVADLNSDITEMEMTTLPTEFKLLQNYPNPFNLETSIGYQLPKTTDVAIKIFNISGQLLQTLIDERLSAGCYSVNWNGRDETGKNVGSGIYFYKLIASDFVQTKKMLLVR